MRYFSNAESVEKREASLLALLETIAAVSLSVWIAVHFGTMKWIAISACLAPLALLRTEESVELGLEMGNRLMHRYLIFSDQQLDERRLSLRRGDPFSQIEDPSSLPCDPSLLSRMILTSFRLRAAEWGLEIVSFIALAAIALALPFIRLIATTIVLIRHPIKSGTSIPRNWYRYIACTDSAYLPEPLPGSKARSGILPDLRWTVKSLAQKPPPFHRPLLFLLLLLLLALFFGPALLFRWSMKATAIVYSPLLWVAWYPFRKIERLDSFLEVVRQSPLGRIVRAYSGLVIAAFATKFFLFTCYNTFADWWDATPLTRFLGLYVAPHDLPLWQMAAFVNATLAIGFFVFAREALVRIKNGMAWPETIVVRLFRSATFVRCLLSLYTIACTLFITVRAASLFHFPGIGTNLFPWSQL